MTQLACPFCGPRALREFEFHKTLPDAAQGSAFERTYERFANLEYSVEHWQHVAGCRGWLQDFALAGEAAGLEDVVATVMAHGLEHHFVLIPGDHAGILAEFAAWLGMTTLGHVPMRDHLEATDFT